MCLPRPVHQLPANNQYGLLPSNTNLLRLATIACGVDLAYWILWLSLGMLVLVAMF